MFDNLKNLKDKAEELAEAHGDTISDGLEKAGDIVDDKTDGKYTDKIETGVDKAQEYVEELGEKKA
ncbi:antitoxin [Streptomyces sp. RLB1-33]|uniref:antitoxin n=1 Tax=Streptomyces mirabilis TaxID=68239 RepID=UPI00143EC5B4|nr:MULTISPECIES: antitoxin [Streptomyces]QIY74711.1 antitoxin [Streptomyces sp. RLB1-33]QUW78126.1 antitoxin [Streptomyces mirabilis]